MPAKPLVGQGLTVTMLQCEEPNDIDGLLAVADGIALVGAVMGALGRVTITVW